MSKTPTAKITIDREYSVSFDLDTIMAIEDATGLTCFDVAKRLALVMPESDTFDGVRVTPAEIAALTAEQRERLVASDEAIEAASRSINIGLVVRFIAGCVRMDAKMATRVIQLGRLLEFMMALLPAFITACTMLSGQAEEREGKAEARDSGTSSEPGLALSSGSNATSSGA